MAHNFGRTMFTPAVRALQEEHGSRRQYARWDQPAEGENPADLLGPNEQRFLVTRDTFYLASVSANGWPYVQHRGGPAGFIRVLDPQTIAFADYRGNKQYVTSGNLATDDRVAMIFMDYPSQTRLKVLGHAERLAPEAAAALFPELADAQNDAAIQYVYVVKVVAFDWNCQQHITPRYTEAQIERATAPLQQRLAELEAENERLKAQAAKA